MNVTLYRGSGQWSALYVDGQLAQSGDHYLCDEKLHQLFGVEVICSDDFLLGNPHARYEQVADTLTQIEVYRQRREAAQARAAELRAEANRLLAEAGALEEN